MYRAGREGSAYAVVRTTVGGRHPGRTELPSRDIVSGYEQAWNLLATIVAVAAFLGIIARSELVPIAREWALAHPLRAVALAHEWPAILNFRTGMSQRLGDQDRYHAIRQGEWGQREFRRLVSDRLLVLQPAC